MSQGNFALFSPPDMARDCCLDLRFFWRVVDTWQELLNLGNRKFMWREICSSTVVRKNTYLRTCPENSLYVFIRIQYIHFCIYTLYVYVYVFWTYNTYLFTQAQKSLYVLICIPYTHFCICCKYIPQKTHYAYTYVCCKPIPVFVYIHTLSENSLY